MRGAPVPPERYVDEGEEVLTDEVLERDGWASGLNAWEQLGKAYEWYLSTGGNHPSGLDNAQMWSLQEAIKAQAIREFAAWIYEHGGEGGHGGDDVRHEVEAFEARDRGAA